MFLVMRALSFCFEFPACSFQMLDLGLKVVFMHVFNTLSSHNYIVQGGHRSVDRGEETHLCNGG